MGEKRFIKFMEAQERKDLIDSLWPVGKLRWFQVEIFDQERAMHNLPWVDKDQERLGFKVNAITCRDDFQPQVVALLDMKDDILTSLMQKQESCRWSNDTAGIHMYDVLINEFRERFKNKIDEINSRTIKTIPIQNEQP